MSVSVMEHAFYPGNVSRLFAVLDGTSQSLNATLNVLYEYAQFSGLKVNFEKTHAVWIGVNKYSTASIKIGGNYHGGKQPLNY